MTPHEETPRGTTTAPALPAPTYMPAVMALGIVLTLWGIVTTLLISLLGIVLCVIALIGWIGEIRRGE